MPTKLLMRWDVRPESETEYFEFLVHEFIPGVNKLGIDDIQIWYTAYGEREQKLAWGITPTLEDMRAALNSEEWIRLVEKLQEFVDNFSQKVVAATRGFQF
jgi:hypothetical protein